MPPNVHLPSTGSVGHQTCRYWSELFVRFRGPKQSIEAVCLNCEGPYYRLSTALLHHITTDLLERSYLSLERSAPGIDGVTWQTYGENLEKKRATTIKASSGKAR